MGPLLRPVLLQLMLPAQAQPLRPLGGLLMSLRQSLPPHPLRPQSLLLPLAGPLLRPVLLQLMLPAQVQPLRPLRAQLRPHPQPPASKRTSTTTDTTSEADQDMRARSALQPHRLAKSCASRPQPATSGVGTRTPTDLRAATSKAPTRAGRQRATQPPGQSTAPVQLRPHPQPGSKSASIRTAIKST